MKKTIYQTLVYRMPPAIRKEWEEATSAFEKEKLETEASFEKRKNAYEVAFKQHFKRGFLDAIYNRFPLPEYPEYPKHIDRPDYPEEREWEFDGRVFESLQIAFKTLVEEGWELVTALRENLVFKKYITKK